jgi:hypothetical protein
MELYDWKSYETDVAALFSKIEGAIVEHDVREVGVISQTERQLDIRVPYPLKIDLGQGFEIPIPIKIIVDCKAHKALLDVKQIEEIIGLREDVQANLAIAITPMGVSKAGRERGKAGSVYPITVTGDLVALQHGLEIPDFEHCLMCEHGNVSTRSRLTGYCSYCGGLHLSCPDCGEIIGIDESQFNKGVKCGAECGVVFYVPSGEKRSIGEIEVYDYLDCILMTKAFEKTTKRLTEEEVSKIIGRTKWQHWQVELPTIALSELGLMEWRAGYFYLTEDGEQIVEEIINEAETAIYY